jgi:hypothetical protein
MKSLEISVAEPISMSERIGIGSTDDNTNRSVRHYDSDLI